MPCAPACSPSFCRLQRRGVEGGRGPLFLCGCARRGDVLRCPSRAGRGLSIPPRVCLGACSGAGGQNAGPQTLLLCRVFLRSELVRLGALAGWRLGRLRGPWRLRQPVPVPC
ncbi:uncharacterized protein Tco025E_09574 [Trypanosoma conorhini]|uniref:Uncharacterized protein n=1 Tax=Trypanosoma conorhini TaxID=83891 RepID=A0A422MZN0_9TRYP|nr:uncharacterized protein Tco025E_09574 [Trypanosoma conorhini]RNE98631.1 hypothetical protein Tco025E_09574 [Trypanosoma conorhini]